MATTRPSSPFRRGRPYLSATRDKSAHSVRRRHHNTAASYNVWPLPISVLTQDGDPKYYDTFYATALDLLNILSRAHNHSSLSPMSHRLGSAPRLRRLNPVCHSTSFECPQTDFPGDAPAHTGRAVELSNHILHDLSPPPSTHRNITNSDTVRIHYNCLNIPHTCQITTFYTSVIQDAQLSQRDRAAGCVIVFAKSRRLELGDNILRTL